MKLDKSASRPVRKEFLVFGSPLIEQPEIDEVVASMKTGWLGTGPKVKKFEDMFREYKGVQHAMALNSCTAGLHVSMLAIGLRPGDEVIVPAMTFAATANSVIHAGGTPVFADCDPKTMNISPESIEKKITKNTQAIMPVHFAGRPCEMDAIMHIANKYNLKVIEDCAHAIESEYKGKKTGTFGSLGCFSFYVTKNIVTGEGGMVITNNEEYANAIKVLGLHGMTKDAWKRFGDEGYKHYSIVYAGFKYNMMDIQAAVGIHQLPRVDKYWEKRRQIWERYNKEFADLPVILPAETPSYMKHAYHLYTLLIDIDRTKVTRDQFLDEMTKRKLGVGVHYISLNLHPFYQKMYGCKRGDYLNSEWVSDRTVSLPISAKLTEDDIEDIIAAVKEILA